MLLFALLFKTTPHLSLSFKLLLSLRKMVSEKALILKKTLKKFPHLLPICCVSKGLHQEVKRFFFKYIPKNNKV